MVLTYPGMAFEEMEYKQDRSEHSARIGFPVWCLY